MTCNFEITMTTLNLEAKNTMKAVIEGLLGIGKDPKYRILVKKILEEIKVLGCNMNVKLSVFELTSEYCLGYCSKIFRKYPPENLGAVSYEQGEIF